MNSTTSYGSKSVFHRQLLLNFNSSRLRGSGEVAQSSYALLVASEDACLEDQNKEES